MKRLLDRLRRSSHDTKSIFKLVGGTAIGQAIAIVLTPIMTRLYAPAVYGEISVLLSITSIASIIICLRYDPAIVVPEHDWEARSLYKLCMIIAAGLSLLVGLVLLGFNRNVFSVLNAPTLAKYWVFIPFLLFFTGVENAGNYWLTRKNQFGSLAKSSMVSTLGATVPAILLGIAGYTTVLSRVMSTTLGVFIWMMYVYVMASRSQGRETWEEIGPDLRTRLRTYLTVAKKFKIFMLVDVWSTLANTISWQVVPILMNSIYSSTEAGQYALGLRMIQVPMSLIGSAISQVFFRTASERRITRDLYPYLKQTSWRLFWLSFIPTIIIGVGGKWMFALIFGRGWGTAGLFCQILAPWAIIWLVASSISPIFMVLQAQKILLLITLLNLVLRIGSIYLGKFLGGANVGVALFSLSGIIVYGVLLYTALQLAKKNDQLPRPEPSGV